MHNTFPNVGKNMMHTKNNINKPNSVGITPLNNASNTLCNDKTSLSSRRTTMYNNITTRCVVIIIHREQSVYECTYYRLKIRIRC